jgi:putative ABC transport system permease protein
MGKILLTVRLVARDLRRRPIQALLMLLAITAATAVLTMGLALRGVTGHPYRQTRAATYGPDVVAQLGGPSNGPHGPGVPPPKIDVTGQIRSLEQAAGVIGHSGPFPVGSAVLAVHGHRAGVEVEGRSQRPASIEQPALVAGHWVRPGGVVLERTFAQALGARVGDRLTLNGRPFTVVGIAVTAAAPPYPNLCYGPGGGTCGVFDLNNGNYSAREIGLAWATEPTALALAKAAGVPPWYFLNLRLAHPGAAQAFVNSRGRSAPGTGPAFQPNKPILISWQDIASADGLLVADEQSVLAPGAWLTCLLAIASVAVLAGGRMAAQNRRIGLLKAVGATPGLVTLVLLAENVVIAAFAAIAGLVIGWLAAPLLTSPGAALIGTPGAPSLTFGTIAEVVIVALLVALLATTVSAIRAGRTSTVSALADAARPPRRRARLIAMSARLPVPLLLGLRLVARRPRRALLSAASIAVTMTGIITVLAFHTIVHERAFGGSSGLGDPVAQRDEQILLVLTVVLLALAVLNAICATWTTVLDTTHAAALVRALGATQQQVAAGLAAAQLLPAIPGALVGVPLGIELFAAANGAGLVVIPPILWLIAAVVAILVATAILTSIPARIGARRPVAEILQSEAA